MRLKPPDIVIDEADPFSTDRLGRADFGLALTELVKSTNTSFVLSLDASWGQGKTTFLQMWRQQLKNAAISSLHFNAWETDFSSDPLVALIGELSAAMSELDVSSTSKAGRQLAKVKKVGVALLKRSIPTAVKLATAGVVDLSDLSEEALSNLGEKIAEDQLARYEEGKKSMSSFRAELEAFAKKLAEQRSSDVPLVVIVDELDRCRPDYAIKVLETVKHLFVVPGVVFVVATDTRQLSNAVRHAYGLETSAADYLRRFFDMTISLPEPETKKFVESQFERFGFDEVFSRRNHQDFRYDKEQAVSALVALCQATKCSLRDQEKCFTLLALAIKTTPDDHYLHPLLLCTLIVLRVKNSDLYADFAGGIAGYEEVLNYLTANEFGRTYFESNRGYGSVIEASLIATRRNRYAKDDLIERYRSLAQDQAAEEASRNRAHRILDVLKAYEFRNMVGSFNYLLKKIELVDRAQYMDD